MPTAFSATRIVGPAILGPSLKVAVYKLQLPSASTEAGEALDLSTDFRYVFGAIFGSSGTVTDHTLKLDLIGTYASTGVVASGLSVVEHYNTDTAAALSIVTGSTDLSAVDDQYMIVFGS